MAFRIAPDAPRNTDQYPARYCMWSGRQTRETVALRVAKFDTLVKRFVNDVQPSLVLSSKKNDEWQLFGSFRISFRCYGKRPQLRGV